MNKETNPDTGIRNSRGNNTSTWDATRAIEQAFFNTPEFGLEDMASMARLYHTGVKLGDIAWIFGASEKEVRAMILLYAHSELERRNPSGISDTP